jgi:hypothetical protein
MISFILGNIFSFSIVLINKYCSLGDPVNFYQQIVIGLLFTIHLNTSLRD